MPPTAQPIPTAMPVATPYDHFGALMQQLEEIKKAIEEENKKAGGGGLTTRSQDHSQIGSAFGEIRKAIGDALPKEALTAGKALTMFTSTLRSAAIAGLALNAVVSIFSDLGKQLASFVQLASPATVQMFNRAVEDTTALIGQGLTPILELVTQVVRSAADSMGGFVRVGQLIAMGLKPLVAGFSVFYEFVGRLGLAIERSAAQLLPAWEAMSQALSEVLDAAQPAIDVLIDLGGQLMYWFSKQFATAVVALVPYITAMARAMGDFATWLAKATRQILALLGVKLPDESGAKPGSSVGAAARGASVGSIDDVIRKTMTSAFSLGTAASSPEMRTASAAVEISEKVTKIYDTFVVMSSTIENLPRNIADAIRSVPREAVNNVERKVIKPAEDAAIGALRDADAFVRRNFGIS